MLSLYLYSCQIFVFICTFFVKCVYYSLPDLTEFGNKPKSNTHKAIIHGDD